MAKSKLSSFVLYQKASDRTSEARRSSLVRNPVYKSYRTARGSALLEINQFKDALNGLAALYPDRLQFPGHDVIFDLFVG
jgi:hypothetical protein